MSDSVIARLTEAVERLTLSTDRLAALLESQAGRPSTEPLPEVRPSSWVGQITVVELSRNPFPEKFREEVQRYSFRGVEDGPLPPLDCCFELASERLSQKPPGVTVRVREAYKAGFWAKCAIDTHTVHHPEQRSPQLRSVHWVCLRSSFPEAFRTTSKRDLERICNISDPFAIIASFESITEVEVYCLGARCAIPLLRSTCGNSS